MMPHPPEKGIYYLQLISYYDYSFAIASLYNSIHSTAFLVLGSLEQDGHVVLPLKCGLRNRVELLVNGERVFTCDIRDLDFGKSQH